MSEEEFDEAVLAFFDELPKETWMEMAGKDAACD
jgi:hypothetical protein